MRFGEGDPFFVLLDRLDRVGTFGIAGEAANTLVNMNNARQLGIDNRIFFVNSALSAQRAFGTWVRQGDATYATVGRPFMMALGFGGALQNFQVANNLLGLDNFESRYVARTNVNNILRSVGKQLRLDVRMFLGGGALPNAMKPWVVEMVLASFANDGGAFMSAYQRALEAARAMGKEDPEKSVKSSFTMYHPLRYNYRTPPTEDEYQMILRAAEGGKQAVIEAITLLNNFGESIGVKPYMGKKPESKGGTTEFKPLKAPSYKRFSVDTEALLPF
jgi:hypothetical protein